MGASRIISSKSALLLTSSGCDSGSSDALHAAQRAFSSNRAAGRRLRVEHEAQGTSMADFV